MSEYKIALLRGINVGGKRKILMADLRALFEDLGFLEVKTYIQSGNVLFKSNTNKNNLSIGAAIAKAIEKKYTFDVPIVVLSVDELKEAVKINSYYTEDADINNLHLTFLSETPDNELLENILQLDYAPDVFDIKGRFVFLNILGKYHKTKLSNNLFEKKLKVSATTRNWKTVMKLLKLSEG